MSAQRLLLVLALVCAGQAEDYSNAAFYLKILKAGLNIVDAMRLQKECDKGVIMSCIHLFYELHSTEIIAGSVAALVLIIGLIICFCSCCKRAKTSIIHYANPMTYR